MLAKLGFVLQKNLATLPAGTFFRCLASPDMAEK